MDDHTVLGRGVEILDVVTSSAGPVHLADLTRLTGVPKPTVRRIARTLVQFGLLRLDSNGFSPGARLQVFGMRAARARGLATTATPYLLALKHRLAH